MKLKSIYFSVLVVVLATVISVQDVAAQGLETVGGNNRWVFHVPKRNNNMYIAPMLNGRWQWGRQTIFESDGDVKFSNSVAIGTNSTSGYKLSVNGNVRAREVRVTSTGWADFVFEDNYALPTLSEVESHIETYGHLPSIPSAAEVEAEGVELGVISSKLLQKTEELTLYVIEQEKRIEALETENEALQPTIQE